MRWGRRYCEAQIWRGWWRARCVASARVDGGEDLVAGALDRLLAQGATLPARARLCLADEHLYYAVLPAHGALGSAGVRDRAQAHFADAVGEADLVVGTSLAPCGSRWVAVAAPRALLEDARSALADRDIRLGPVGAALLEDLHAVGRQLPRDAGVVVLRDEGAMLVALSAGSVVEIAWERCELARPGMLEARARAFRRRHAAGEPGEARLASLPLFALGSDERQQASMFTPGLGVRWLNDVADAPRAPAPAGHSS